MKSQFNIKATYSLQDIREICEQRRFHLDEMAQKRVEACRQYLVDSISSDAAVFYGINTGFGALCNIRISKDELQDLQHNLIRSHACGAGPEVNDDIVRIMLLLKIISLSQGHSGVRWLVIERMVELFNRNILPVVYEQGSLGASGDLAPLAHLGLVIIGEGQIKHNGVVRDSREVLDECDLEPIALAAKEGLAILNGTQFSTAHALWSCIQCERLMSFANATAALSIESFNCSAAPFTDLLHEIRNQIGQQVIARDIRNLLKNSDLDARTKYSVQDPYAFRCVPQVHGASKDTLDYVSQIVSRELNGVTDNPNIFPQAEKILSGGNFHAQPIAYACDFLAIAAAEIGSISERRTYQLVSGLRGLPPFLTPNAGSHSGLMIPQYTAASIVSQNKQLCTPASVDSITSSIGQEDHVSMAANAGTKLIRIINNLKTILSIEWMTGAQAMEFRKQYHLGERLQVKLDLYREKYVSALKEDRILFYDIQKTQQFFDDHF